MSSDGPSDISGVQMAAVVLLIGGQRLSFFLLR